MVKITISAGSHYNIVTCRHRLYSSLGTSPGHHYCTRSQSSLENLIPAYHFPTLGCDELPYSMNHITLQSVNIRNIFVRHPLLTLRARLPMLFSCFVTTYMDIF